MPFRVSLYIMKEFRKIDILALRRMIRDLYKTEYTDLTKPQIIGYSGNVKPDKSEDCFILSDGDEWATNAISYWVNNEEIKHISLYQFIMEDLLWKFIDRYYPNGNKEDKIKIYQNLILGITLSNKTMNIITFVYRAYTRHKRENNKT